MAVPEYLDGRPTKRLVKLVRKILRNYGIKPRDSNGVAPASKFSESRKKARFSHVDFCPLDVERHCLNCLLNPCQLTEHFGVIRVGLLKGIVDFFKLCLLTIT